MSDLIGRLTDRRSRDAETDTETDRDTTEDRTPDTLERRRLLTVGGAAGATLLAGCSGLVPKGGPFSDADGPRVDTATPEDTPDDDSSSGTSTPAGTPTPDTDVVGLVRKQTEESGSYQFIVTLSVPPEAGGADWWQVETLDGTKLGRREFDSPRTESEFTTSKALTVEESSAVVVRGHDAEVGYGGQVILLDMESGTIDVARQGEERESFENYSF